MLFVIHNLPKNTRYADIKAMLSKRCGLTEFIMDNLSPENNDTKKVTIGLASDADASLLKRNVHGYKIDNYQLYVEDKKPKPKEPPSRAPVQSTARNAATFNIPSGLQPPRSTNKNQYVPTAQNHDNYGQNWAQQTVGAQLGRQTATNNNPPLVQYPQQKYGQTGNYGSWGANQNQSWGSSYQNQGWEQSSHDFGWANTEQNQTWGANNQGHVWTARNQNQSWAADNQQTYGFNNQSQGWEEKNKNSGAKPTNQSQDWGINNQNQGWRSNNQEQGSRSNNRNRGWSPNRDNDRSDRSQVWEANDSYQGSYNDGQTSWSNARSQRRRSPSPMFDRRSNQVPDRWESRRFDSQPTPRNRSRSPHRNRDQPNRPSRPSRPEPSRPNRQQSGPSRFNSDERSREIEWSQSDSRPSDGRGPQGGRWASVQTDQGTKRTWNDEHGPGLGPGPWRYRPSKKVREREAAAAANPEGFSEPPKKKVTFKKMTKRNEYYRKRTTIRIIEGIFEHLKLNQDDNVLKFYFNGPVRSRLGNLLGDAIDAKLEEMYDHYMDHYKHDEDQKIYEEALRLQSEDKKLDQFLENSGMSVNKAGSDAVAYLRSYKRDPKLMPPNPKKPNRPRKRKRPGQNANGTIKPKVEPSPILPIHKIPAFINNSKTQFKEMKRKHLQNMLTLECPKVNPKYEKIINVEMDIFRQMFHNVVEQLDKPKKDYFNVCPISALALDFTKTLKQNLCERLTNTGIKMIRIYGAPLLPKKPALEAFLKDYGALSLKKSTRKFLYTAVINNYKNFDLLCNMEPVDINGHKALFKPLHIAPKVPRKHVVANVVHKRDKYIKDQIQKPIVNLLDKDWVNKLAALEKEDKKIIQNEIGDAVVKIEKDFDIKTEESGTKQDSENNFETELDSENNIKNKAFIANDDQNTTLDIKEDNNTTVNQDIDFAADLDTYQDQSAGNNDFANDEFTSGNQNQSVGNKESVSDNQNKSADNNEFASDNEDKSVGDNEFDKDEFVVSDTSMLKEYSGVKEREIIFEDDDEDQGNNEGVNNTEGDEQQLNDHSDDVDDEELEYNDQEVADDIDLDNINDDDLEDY